MVAVIKAGRSIRNALHYNENKVERKRAELLSAIHFGKDKEALLFTDKVRRFEKLISLNERTKVNSIHISLNFDPSERLSKQVLTQIASDYMQGIGFESQPYLVYQHHDAGHPHLHIVTTNIQKDGSRIKLHNIGRNLSERTRKEIEIKFALVEASDKQRKREQLNPVNALKAQYGKSETKRAITNVLDAVLHQYKYTSLAELNAVLQLYNVVADRGSEASRIYQRKGLIYRILNERGEKVGVPIKASLIYNKPTLKTIEAKFAQNDRNRQAHKQRVKNAVDLSLLNRQPSINDLQQTLSRQQIQLILRQNSSGVIYGLTYVDHQTKCVFNGSDLGKQYSANTIQLRCSKIRLPIEQKQQALSMIQSGNDSGQTNKLQPEFLHNLLQSVAQPDNGALTAELKEEHKRKRKKKQHQ